MGRIVRPFFDHNSPEWPENERRYIESMLHVQMVMKVTIYGSILVAFFVLMIVLFFH